MLNQKLDHVKASQGHSKMQDGLHLIVHLVGYRRVDHHVPLHICQIVSHDCLEELGHLLIAIVAAINHAVIGLIVEHLLHLDVCDGFELLVHRLLV